jgi:hypothetical protein
VTPSAAPAVSVSGRPGSAAATTGRPCWVLVACWAVCGAAGCAWLFLISTQPYTVPADPPSAPAWIPVPVSAAIEVGGLFLSLPWAVLPVVLLIAGLARLRRAGAAGWWLASWAVAVAAGIGLEVLTATRFAVPWVSPAFGGPPGWAPRQELLAAVRPRRTACSCARTTLPGSSSGRTTPGGPVDVWAVTGIGEEQMIDNGNGFLYFPGRISAGRISLVEWPSSDAAPAGSPARKRKRQRKKTPRNRDGGHSRRSR